MTAFLIYVLKSALVLALLVSLFIIFMSRETFHRVNRYIMLSIVFLALLLPAVNLGIESPFNGLGDAIEDYLAAEEPEAVMDIDIEMSAFDELPVLPEAPLGVPSVIMPVEEEPFNWLLLAAVVYFAGVALLVVRQVVMYVQVARMIARGRVVDASMYGCKGINLRVHRGKEKPFSWFRWVVVSENDLGEGAREILIHETAHAHAGHSWDIVLADAVIIMQWFNPLAWIMKNSLKDIHEFEADEAVTNSGVNAKQYQLLIIKKAVGARLYSIANSFNHSSTIKRITMMCKKKSNLWRCSKLLCTLPVVAIATLLFSQPESINATEQPSDGKVTEFVAYEQETRPTIAPTPEKRVATAVGDVSKATPNDTVPNKERVYQVVEQMPQFPGGQAAMMKFLQENINYPADARNANDEGRAFVNFIVSDKGEILNITIVKSTGNAALDKEAVRVVSSMPAWAPGKQGGKAVYTQLTLPVAFKLSNPKKVSKALFLPREEKNGSTTEANSPLLVINGAIYEGNADILNNFKEEDIESINVLQEESAVKTYGEKAKHGAIIIELKKRASSTPIIPEKQAPQADDKSIYTFNSNTGRNKIELTNATNMPDDAMSKTLQITKSDAADYDKAATFTGNLQELKLSNNKMIVESGFTKGRVTMEFNVETDGTLTFAKVKQSSGNNIVDTVALTALLNTQGKWQPATKDGKPVRSRPTLSITFQKMQ